MTALRKRLLDVFEIEYREHLEAIRTMLARAAGSGGGGVRDSTCAKRRGAPTA